MHWEVADMLSYLQGSQGRFDYIIASFRSVQQTCPASVMMLAYEVPDLQSVAQALLTPALQLV